MKKGIHLPDGDVVHTIYIEIKNKHNTMNSADSSKTYIKMQGQLLEDDDCACLLVEAIAKKSQNIKWETMVDKKKVSHKRIRRVSMDRFYELVTGDENAFYKMCMKLPLVVDSIVKEEKNIDIPKDTVVDDLDKLPSIIGEEEVNIAKAMAIYMLGFSTYNGFGDKILDSFGLESKESILKKIDEYVGDNSRFADGGTHFYFF